ncbi:branched-chain amino acid ABC transporter permease [Conexibacter sp. CPCC 206217]|uniref:branched-chain amino acid ABC transporter permease n=1 Tax=Conexibacter sp. CPCC 206217 TaxID=3064574 RepID=UPI00271E5975|nr:branched-chain amino acid ABC transporter permease [Conexibacter sp. CPCC 206217]MDO8210098.1 branched-chain amino acid ABC transporter permease [Conexibacter sp. CPCC 206217]
MHIVEFASISSVLQHVIDAFSGGSLYALFALAIALVFGIVRLINFAQGAIMTVAAYGLLVVEGVPVIVKLVVVIVVAVGLSLAVDRVAFRPIRDVDPTTLLVTSFAVGSLLQALLVVIDQDQPRSTEVSSWLSSSLHVGSLVVSWVSVATIVATALLLIALVLFLRRSTTGLEMRAVAENFRMSQALGVRSNRVIAVAFAISGVLTGITAFFLIAQSGTISPTIGITPLLFGFIGTVVGGIGSLPGAVAGGYLLGVLTEALQAALPDNLVPYRDAFVFGAVFFLLVFRPQGLFGSNFQERV